MPTKREREYYAMGFRDGFTKSAETGSSYMMRPIGESIPTLSGDMFSQRKSKRKLSAWQRYIKNKRNHITYRDGKLNLKAMGVQYRKKKRR